MSKGESYRLMDSKITVNYRIIPDRTAYSADEYKSSIKNLVLR